jgi:hypothetical protein
MSLSTLPGAAERFVRLSRAMMWLATIGIVLVIGLSLLGAVFSDWTRNFLLARLGQTGAVLPIDPSGRAITAAIIAVPVGAMAWGLWHVRALFAEFAAGRVFSASAARHLQMFGASVLVQAPLGPLISVALTVALTLGNPPGERMLAIAFSINDYFALIVGGVLFAAASVMREAARIAEENAGFV